MNNSCSVSVQSIKKHHSITQARHMMMLIWHHVCNILQYEIILPYPRERGPMGGVPYIGPRLGGGPIFEVSVAHLDAKERPGKLPTLSS